jgi:tRNA (guanine37-N1)-methyltransferase
MTKDSKEASAVTTAAATTPRILPLSEFPDAATFVRTQVYPALQVPVRYVAQLRRQLSSLLLRLPRVKNVVLPPTINNEKKVSSSASATATPPTRILILQDQKNITSNPVLQQCLEQYENCQLTQYTVTTTYEHWTTDQVLRHILPKDTIPEIPSAFETVGHIAHLNLRDECIPYKYWIGKVLLDKHQPQIQTVVCKIGHIDNVYRTFPMEVLATTHHHPNANNNKDKTPWSQVTVKEEGCVFSFDFTQVYWNSRLAGEHKRIVTLLQNEAAQKRRPQQPPPSNAVTPLIVADVMAGVGPFAIPLTVNTTTSPTNLVVYANDLNPSSYRYLLHNKQINKCSEEQLRCYNMDGRAFVQYLARERIPIDHAILNLPASAPEFLNAFCGFPFRPRLHVHCFGAKTDASTNYQSAVDRCAQALGLVPSSKQQSSSSSSTTLDRMADQVQVHVVRDVAPTKYMLCISFVLPAAVCTMSPIDLSKLQEEQNKQQESASCTPTESQKEDTLVVVKGHPAKRIKIDKEDDD